MKDFFDSSEVLSVLQGFNPWWNGQGPAVPDFQRLAFQACRRYLADASLRRAILLSGPRRVGKTTILLQLAAALIQDTTDPKSVLFVSMDHPLLKLVDLPVILRLYHEHIYPEGKPVVLLLDEIHYAADWELQIKQLVDHKPQCRIVATGSASVVHRQRLTESGVGRWIRVPVPTLSFYEFLHIRQEQVPAVPADLRLSDVSRLSGSDLKGIAMQCRPVLPLFSRYLLVGGFPETARQRDISLCQRLLREDVVERVLKRDMTTLFGIRNVGDLEKLFIYICLHSGDIFGVQTCATALGVSATTINNHLEALDQANLIYRLSPAETGGKKVLKARYKIYLVDAALRNAVLLRGEEILANPDEMGTIVETTILRHLYAYYYQDTPRILYWRDAKTDREVDVIVKSPNYTIPFEVKYVEDATLDASQGIVTYCREEAVPRAYWVTKRDEDFGMVKLPSLQTEFFRIPAHILAYLLGQSERLLWNG